MSLIKDSVVGFAIGDAMGVPISAVPREELLKKPVTSMIGNGTYNVPAGTWSDDTSLVLATMDSIINFKEISYNDIAKRFCSWAGKKEYTATGEVFDIDNTTKKALVKFLKEGETAVKCGSYEINSNGNGSLTRMLPIALYCHFNKLKDYEVFNVVKNTSSITHANEVSILGCYIYVNYLLFILNGKDKYASYNMVKCLDYSDFDEDTVAYYNRLLKTNIGNLRIEDLKSTSYIVYTLEAVIWIILNTNSYAESIVGAINLGDDTDTIGAITGSIAGILYGYDDIPKKWLSSLKRIDYIEKLVLEFEEVLS
ncbi:MAG: ADP-ribosylglycohydrolase family protein [Bacilli bacterium]|nr:ADP-ribosylglycohydrolase family protein [Bacilli bacterium]